MNPLRFFIGNESGATAMEYGLLVALLSFSTIVILWLFGIHRYFLFLAISLFVDGANPN